MFQNSVKNPKARVDHLSSERKKTRRKLLSQNVAEEIKNARRNTAKG